MAGQVRPKCDTCGKYYKYDWNTETFKKICDCRIKGNSWG